VANFSQLKLKTSSILAPSTKVAWLDTGGTQRKVGMDWSYLSYNLKILPANRNQDQVSVEIFESSVTKN
jgi:hypothetical protein